MRTKDEPAPFQFRVELRDTHLEFGALDAQTEVADPRIEQPLAGQGRPGKTAPAGSSGRTAGTGSLWDTPRNQETPCRGSARAPLARAMGITPTTRAALTRRGPPA